MPSGQGIEFLLHTRVHGLAIVLIHQRQKDSSLLDVDQECVSRGQVAESSRDLHEVEEESQVFGRQIDVDHFIQNQGGSRGRRDSTVVEGGKFTSLDQGRSGL